MSFYIEGRVLAMSLATAFLLGMAAAFGLVLAAM